MKTLILKTLLLLFVIVLNVSLYSQTITTVAGSVNSCPGEIQIPLSVTNCNGVGAISLILNFDTTKLNYIGYQNINSNLLSGLLIVNSTGSKVAISWANTTAVNIGNNTLLVLRFNAITSATNLIWDTQTNGNCEYSDISGNIVQSGFTNGTVFINQSPVISIQPTDKTILVGQSTTFSVTAIGAGIAYQWQVSSDGGINWLDILNNTFYSGVTSQTLTISNSSLTFNDSKYRCKLTSCPPVVYSNPATLAVFNPITTTFPTANACPGSIVVPVSVTNFSGVAAFSLVFSYNTTCLNYTGFQLLNGVLSNGNYVVNASGGKIYFTWSSTTAATFGNGTLIEFLFTATTGTSNLTWDVSIPGNCEFTAFNGSQISPVFVNGSENIYTIPTVTAQPVNKVIAKGQNTSFNIISAGNGLSHIWQVSINDGISFSDLTNGGYYSGVNTTTLTITNAQLAINNYQYRCKVTGSCSPIVYSNPATLTVMPNIITTIGSATSCPGQLIIPITVSDFIGVASFSLTLNVNSSILSYTGYQNLNAAVLGGIISANMLGNKVFLTLANTSPATISNGSVLVELIFNALPGSSTLVWDTQTSGNCEYSDISGQTIYPTWNNGNVSINTPPSIILQPLSSTIYATGNTSFSITAAGTNLSYQWQVSSNNGANWVNLSNASPYSGVNTTTLSINPATITMNGYLYKCVVSGTCYPIANSNTGLLTVTQAAIYTTPGVITNSCTGNLNIPIIVSNCINVGGISLTTIFDTTKMSFEGYYSLNSSLTNGLLVVNQSANRILLSWASTTAANIGSDTLIRYRFKAISGITSTLSWDTQTPGFCEYSDLSGNVIPAFYNNATVSVIANALLVNAGNDTTIIPGGNTQLNGSVSGGVVPITYLWTPSIGLSNTAILNPIATPTSTITYTLKGTAFNSCSGSDQMTINIISLPSAAGTISGSVTVCQGQNNVNYNVPAIANATSYIWTLPTGATGTSNSNSISVNYGTSAVSGNITVKGHNLTGDGAPSGKAIIVNPQPIANAGTDILVCTGDTARLVATGGVSYQWNNGIIQNVPFIPEITANYIVQVTNQFNCTKSDTVLVVVEKKLLLLNALLEGLYAGNSLMNNALNENGEPQWDASIADKVNIDIRSASSPYNIVESISANLSANSEIKTLINCHNNASYYIVIRNRNHLETWSATPVLFAGDTVLYNFTNAANKAYGDNQKQVAPGIYAILAGDADGSGYIDGDDFNGVDNLLYTGGYLNADVNGNGYIDGDDFNIIDNNLYNGVITP